MRSTMASDRAWLADALAALREGNVVAAPTESYYGLLADALVPSAVDRLFELKQRDAGVALMLPNVAAWDALVNTVPRAARHLASVFWPGPLTIALDARPSIDLRLTVNGTVGVRVAGNSRAAELCRAFGRPVTATSANLHGAPPATSDVEVRGAFAAQERSRRLHVVAGTSPGGAPSTVVVVKNGQILVAREGAIASRDIEAAGRAAL